MWWHKKVVAHVKIGELVEGTHARVIGNTVSQGDDVSGPHTGTLGLASKAWIYMPGHGGVSGEQAKVERAARFAIQDGTGTVVIANDHVTVDIEAHIVNMTPPEKPAFGASIIAREAGYGGGLYGSGVGSVVNYHEGMVVAGDIVAVIGIVTRGADGALVLAGTEKEPLVISTNSKQLNAVASTSCGARSTRRTRRRTSSGTRASHRW